MKKEYLALFFLSLVCALFFYKFIFLGLVPFPGDLLIGEYGPWKTYSYLGYVPGSFPNKAQYFDVIRQLYPWKTLVIDTIKNGSFPLWNPYNFSGSPLFANVQSAVLYPLNVLYFIFPQIIAWSILVFAQPLIACLFTYLYARKINVGIIGSLFAAISFGFSSFFSVWLEYNTIGQVICYLPMALFAVEQFFSNRKKRFILLFIFSLVSASLAGHIQVFAYFFFFVGVYIFFRAKSLGISFPFVLFFSMLLSLGLSSVQFIPSLELIIFSARNTHPYTEMVEKILIQPWQLVMLLVPDFFGNPATRNYWIPDTYVGKVTSIGFVALIFILFSFVKKKPFFFRFFSVASLIVLVFATLNPITAILYRFDIPFVSSSAPTLGVFIFCFSMSVLAGFGIDVFLRDDKLKNKYCPFIIVGGTLFVLWIVVFASKYDFVSWKQIYLIGMKPLLYASLLFVLTSVVFYIGFLLKQIKIFLVVIFLLLQIGDTFRFFQKFNPFSPIQSVFPKADVLTVLQNKTGINRFWGYGTAAIEANFATQYRLFSPEGYDPLYPSWYGSFLPSTRDGKLLRAFTPQTRSDAIISQGYGKDNFVNDYRDRVLDMLGVFYILDRDANGLSEKSFIPDRYRLIYQKDGWKIFENKKALPRAFFASQYRIFTTPKAFEDAFFAKSFDPKATVLLNENPGVSSLVNGEAAIVSYAPENVVIKTNSAGDSLLVLSDAYYPGWQATVDGQQTHIFKADYAFRAVVVPKGSHVVIFTFFPLSFKIGIMLSVVSFAFVSIFVFFSKKQKI
ncbi:MAG: YfhO family protein [Candidatus Levyibacteriota bacterium]|nr:MAG: YfhO family protein [Candidatus Levybacteria bacterium]